MTLFGIGFLTPWLLAALALLPIIYFLIRATPPPPVVRRFPAVTLLLGLKDKESVLDRTPWWLLLLRLLVIAGVIVAFAGPIINPTEPDTATRPVLIMVDGSWADAQVLDAQKDQALRQAGAATRNDRPVGILNLSTPDEVTFSNSNNFRRQIENWQARPFSPNLADVVLPDGEFDTHWFTSGIAWRDQAVFVAALQNRGAVTVHRTEATPVVVEASRVIDGKIEARLARIDDGEAEVILHARGPYTNGVPSVLATATVGFAAGQRIANATFDLPAELRNRVTDFQLVGQAHAGGRFLTGAALKRPEIALFGQGAAQQETLALLAPKHYLRQALGPFAEIMDLPINDVLPANPDVIVMADVPVIPSTERVWEWVNAGGTLLRFSGPRLAAHDRVGLESDPLLPVRLRSGGRQLGGAMTWGAPKRMAEFSVASPFYGLKIPGDLFIRAQVLAEPGPNLSERVIARLSDGTPLISRQIIGQGQVVLFHVTANAEWSNLPLSQLFLDMLTRLSVVPADQGEALPEADQSLSLVQEITIDGAINPVDDQPAILGQALAELTPTADVPAGLYTAGDQVFAVNIAHPTRSLTPFDWPQDVTVTGRIAGGEKLIGPWILLTAIALFLIDVFASLFLSGRLGQRALIAMLACLILWPSFADRAVAQPADEFAIAATDGVALAYVKTGEARVDETSLAGLRGLGMILWQRTAIEPLQPVGLDLAKDELAFFPLIYWPITLSQNPPSDDTIAKLNRYLRGGGMILFDTRDGDRSGFGQTTAEGRKLQEIAAGLAIPPLAPIGERHVLTRSFYLLQSFPGRHRNGPVWVEATFANGAEGGEQPLGQQNDGVTPVVIGGNGWAAAWAVDGQGRPSFRIGRGFEAEQQREFARRFGVNLMMHVLTGNYKSDQVHMPDLIERLGEE